MKGGGGIILTVAKESGHVVSKWVSGRLYVRVSGQAADGGSIR